MLRTLPFSLLGLLLSMTPLSSQNNGPDLPSGPTIDPPQFTNYGAPPNDVYLPVIFNKLTAATGSSVNIDDNDLFDAICLVNQYFAPGNIQFYILDIVSDTVAAELVNFPEEHPSALVDLKRPDVINIFVASLLLDGFYAFGPMDYIVMNRLSVSDDKYYLAHELGHMFGLLSTYQGWPIAFYFPGNPPEFYDVTGTEPASATTPNGQPAELADGSNCTTTGDRICDTPPDYRFSNYFQNCEQNVIILDANSDTIPWRPGNIMGNFENCPLTDYFFSDGQFSVMLDDIMSDDRAYLFNLPPPITEGPEEVAITGPSAEDLANCSARCTWESAGEGASYFFEISDLPFNFSPNVSNRYTTILDEAQILLTCEDTNYPMLEGQTYYYRVRVLYASADCSPNDFSGPFTFTFPESCCTTNTNELAALTKWTLFPNPASQSRAVFMRIQNTTPQVVTVSVYNASGQAVHREIIDLLAGQQVLPLPTSNWGSGVYYVHLATQDKNSSRRFILQ
ncbi:MAG: zinc-dependent metalloprotease, partial [Bacteroidota bacterium]